MKKLFLAIITLGLLLDNNLYSKMTLKEVLEDFMAKKNELKEFEKELKKNKDMLTPGQVGDA